ncbi:MAG: putative stomatin/prohibitin-family membrane protease subunit YbbK [Anaerolineae bacterium]|jgi:regulator of protease activity HflC (stomatin/prohibitin superfamily)|nr:MAG: putative stomatin/prohibitin-family membrane protease subunit YbbK [Anaerolineae bacterium]
MFFTSPTLQIGGTEFFGTLTCLIGVVVVLAVLFLASAIRIVPEYQRLVVFRLGRCIGSRGPGIVLLIPVIDRAVRVDLREQVREIPHQTAITKDNAPISIDFLWYFKVLDPTESVLQVGNFEAAAQGMATTTLRAVIGGIVLDDVLSEREHINNMLRTRLDEVTERWGVKVTNVEIREIIPPREVQEAMNRQMSAERIRRAVVTESTGTREAAINVAEGEKQAAILRAEGEKQAAILRAEGERQAQMLRAEGFSVALNKIFEVAKTIDQKTMTLQYFEALKNIGASPSTKYIFPLEFTSMLENFVKGKSE